MMRLFFALLAATACALMGMQAANALKTRAENLAAWVRALEMIDLKLLSEGLSLREAVLQDSDSVPARRLLAFSEALKKNPRFSAKEAWEASGAAPASPEDRILAHCFFALGAGEMEKRRTEIAQASVQLRMLQLEAEEKVKKDARLYRTMGFSGAAALFMMLL